MKKIKLLITTGCSFTQYPNQDTTWAYHLSEYLGCKTLFLGQGAAGNGIIARHTIYNTLQALETYNPEDILVGIMWTEAIRSDIVSKQTDLDFYPIYSGPTNENYRNPVKIHTGYHHYIINPHFDDTLSKTYYNNFFDLYGAYIRTIELILQTQWLLKLKQIPYFMTTAFNSVFPQSSDYKIKLDPELRFLQNQIDMTQFLNINNCLDWCVNESGYPLPRAGDDHPSTLQHREFTNKIIIPHLEKNNLI